MNTFKFFISRNCTVKEVQDRFSEVFPFLRINFFSPTATGGRISLQESIFCPDAKLSEINQNLSSGEFEMADTMTLTELENKVKEQFGLTVQVSRKSGNLWLDSAMTNSYTLKEQNDHGKEISPEVKSPVYFRDVPFGC